MLIYHPIYKGGTFNFLKFSFSYTGMNHLSTGGRISNFTSIFMNLYSASSSEYLLSQMKPYVTTRTGIVCAWRGAGRCVFLCYVFKLCILIYLCLVKKRLFIVKLKSLYKTHHR